MSWSTDDVVRMPVSPSPTRVPTSWPARSERVTPTPTSSNTGCSRISAITIDPTTPVPHTTTRFLTMTSLSIEGCPDPVLGEAVVLECVGVRRSRLALLGLLVELLDRRLHLGRPVEPELVVHPASHPERIGDQVLEGDVDELALVVRRSGVVERVEGPRPEVELGVADDAADVRGAVPDGGLGRQ